jgi:hypothetical protein
MMVDAVKKQRSTIRHCRGTAAEKWRTLMSHAPFAIGKPAHTLLAVVFGTAIAYLGVLDSQRSLYTAQQTLVGVKLSRLQNWLTLAGVGGGWSEHSAQNAGLSRTSYALRLGGERLIDVLNN